MALLGKFKWISPVLYDSLVSPGGFTRIAATVNR